MRRLFLTVTLLLTGCAGFNPFGPGPVDPEDATAKPDLVLTGAGVLKFQCSADKDGYWWRFIAPEVVLMNPAGRKIATQGADFNFTAPMDFPCSVLSVRRLISPVSTGVAALMTA